MDNCRGFVVRYESYLHNETAFACWLLFYDFYSVAILSGNKVPDSSARDL
jgi:hypothetical protein